MSMSTRIYIIFVLFVMLWCAGILAAPLLSHFGITAGAGELYSFFSRVCHQDGVRSFHFGGEKTAVCIRCSAIYFSFLAGLLLMPMLIRLERTQAPNAAFLILIFLPMVIDVALNDSGIYTSTTATRMITGVLVGGTLPWWVVPLMIEAWSQLLSRKKNHPHNSGVHTYVRKTQ